MTPAAELRAAAERLAEVAATHGHDKVDLWGLRAGWMDPWVQLMSPQLGPLLASWLRGEAWVLDQVARDFADSAGPEAVQHMELIAKHALGFARVVNRSEESRFDA